MVNDVGHSVFISPVRNDPDMLLKNHKIPALPFLGPGHIRGPYNRMMRKKHLQISHPAKINVGIRLPDIVPLRMLLDIGVHQRLQIISGIFQRKSHHIGTHAIAIVRISGLIITALVFWTGIHIGQRIVEHICLVIHTVIVRVHRAVKIRNLPHWSCGRTVEVC